MLDYQKLFNDNKIKLSDIQINKLKSYAELIKLWNKKINLTAVDDDEGILCRHFLDSLLVLNFIPINHNNKIVDIGTGAGFPGLPLAIATGAETFLFDALNKRINFLREVIENVTLDNVDILHARAEDVARISKFRGQYDYAFSRAVSSLNVLIELAVPLLKVGGSLIVYKSDGIEDELLNAKKALSELDAEIIDVIEYRDYYGKVRNLVRIEKLKTTKDKYPRRNGVPNKKPLM